MNYEIRGHVILAVECRVKQDSAAAKVEKNTNIVICHCINGKESIILRGNCLGAYPRQAPAAMPGRTQRDTFDVMVEWRLSRAEDPICMHAGPVALFVVV